MITQTACTGPKIRQSVVLLLLLAILLVAVLIPIRQPDTPDLPMPVCENGIDCIMIMDKLDDN